jgi:pilus assembly protein Flp/PilA
MRARPNLEEFHVLPHLVKCRVRLQNSERGATAVEYGLMVALIAIVIIVAVQALGSNLSSLFNTVSTSV